MWTKRRCLHDVLDDMMHSIICITAASQMLLLIYSCCFLFNSLCPITISLYAMPQVRLLCFNVCPRLSTWSILFMHDATQKLHTSHYLAVCKKVWRRHEGHGAQSVCGVPEILAHYPHWGTDAYTHGDIVHTCVSWCWCVLHALHLGWLLHWHTLHHQLVQEYLEGYQRRRSRVSTPLSKDFSQLLQTFFEK